MVYEDIGLKGPLLHGAGLGELLEEIERGGADYEFLDVEIGEGGKALGPARVRVRAPDFPTLEAVLERLSERGVDVELPRDADLVEADVDGAFPEGFYSTTNQPTWVRHGGRWHEVARQEMDCGIRYDPEAGDFRCVPLLRVRTGDLIVRGDRGIRVLPLSERRRAGPFGFMGSEVSSEKPKWTLIRRCAETMWRGREEGLRQLLVGGPAIVHTGAADHVVRLIERGYIQVLFAGNALAVHDVEQALYGTSLGIALSEATPARGGHAHHMRAINAIRRAGGLREAVEAGVLTSGIMHACVVHGVDTVLAGSIRDDGPLPGVVTDAVAAQQRMREHVREIDFALMVATGLHSIATGNLLPAWIPVFSVDISPSILTKLADRGSFQTTGLVTDVEPFFRALLSALESLESGSREAPEGGLPSRADRHSR